LIDQTGFFVEFQDMVDIPENLASADLEGIRNLDSLEGVKVYRELTDIIKFLVQLSETHRDPHLCYRILLFISRKFPDEDRVLEHRSFILTADEKLGTLRNLSLPNRELEIEIPSFINLSFLHPKVLSFDQTNEVSKWLKRKGCSPITISEILSKYIVPPLKNSTTEKSQNFELMRFLFKLYSAELISEFDLSSRKEEICAITRERTYAPVHSLYFSEFYDSSSQADEMFGDQKDFFLTSAYVPEGERKVLWTKFFRKLGVKSDCGLRVLDHASVEELKKEGISKLEDFLSYLNSPPNALIGRNPMAFDSYSHFVFFPHLEFLTKSTQFSTYFWRVLNQEGKRWIEKDKTCHFKSTGNKQSTLLPHKKTYLHYVLTTFPWILGTDGQHHPSCDLYSPLLRNVGLSVTSMGNVSLR
jgi:hypothetical protein